MMLANLILPWVFAGITAALLLVPNRVQKKIIYMILFVQIIINLAALILAATNLSSYDQDALNLGLSISAIIMSVVLFLFIIWRR